MLLNQIGLMVRSDIDRSSETPLVQPLRVVGLAVVVLFAAVAASQLVELLINRVLRPDLAEWTWISEALLVAALLVFTVQWARLRLARSAIADLERERVTIHAELAVAATVQRGLLPLIPPPAGGISWGAVMEPAGQIGGDYYDFFRLDGDRICVVLADVSGKGVPAAVFVSNTRAVLRAVARADRSGPATILATVSDTLLMDSRSGLYVTCIVAVVDTAQHTIVYANAGHPPGVVVGASGGVQSLGVGGPPLGLISAARYDEQRIVLIAGDLVVLVSDGITDAIDATGDAITKAIAGELIAGVDMTPGLRCRTLIDTAGRSPGPPGMTGWADDRTVVAFAFNPRSPQAPAAR